MSRAEKFISEQTRKLTQYGDDYFLWITPDQAKRAVEIAKEEVIEEAVEWLKFNLQDYAGEDSCRNSVPFDKDVFEAFRKAMMED